MAYLFICSECSMGFYVSESCILCEKCEHVQRMSQMYSKWNEMHPKTHEAPFSSASSAAANNNNTWKRFKGHDGAAEA
jgi:hypothetical protein